MAANINKRSASLSEIPSDFSLNYLGTTELTLKSKQQGFKYFTEGYFHNVGIFKDDNARLSVSAKCFRSQRKNEKPHLLNIQIGDTSIDFAYCSCQAGMCGSCSHIVGLVQALHQWQLLGFSSVPAELSCTSLPQQWSKPRGHKVEPEAVPNMQYVNAKADRKRVPVWNKLFDNRKISLQSEDMEHLQALDCGIGYLISQPPQTVQTHLGTVPVGSGLATHAQFYNTAKPKPVSTTCGDLNFPLPSALNISNFDRQKLPTVSLPDCVEIEKRTRDQADSSLWFKERQNRLTASQFGLIAKRKKSVTDQFVRSLKDTKQVQSEAINYGKNNERRAIEKYMQETGRHTHKSGLIVNPAFSFLGASPDSFVCDEGKTGILEVKCPHSARDKTIMQACESRDFCLETSDNGVKLKTSHNYYYQVQGQLMVSGATFCDFVVWTKRDIHIERIHMDNIFCQNLLEILYMFYIKYFQ